jgi:hypothetical protein
VGSPVELCAPHAGSANRRPRRESDFQSRQYGWKGSPAGTSTRESPDRTDAVFPSIPGLRRGQSSLRQTARPNRSVERDVTLDDARPHHRRRKQGRQADLVARVASRHAVALPSLRSPFVLPNGFSRLRAVSRLPLRLTPISATTKHGSPSPTQLSPILTLDFMFASLASEECDPVCHPCSAIARSTCSQIA